jgi:hypothetical protein
MSSFVWEEQSPDLSYSLLHHFNPRLGTPLRVQCEHLRVYCPTELAVMHRVSNGPGEHFGRRVSGGRASPARSIGRARPATAQCAGKLETKHYLGGCARHGKTWGTREIF